MAGLSKTIRNRARLLRRVGSKELAKLVRESKRSATYIKVLRTGMVITADKDGKKVKAVRKRELRKPAKRAATFKHRGVVIEPDSRLSDDRRAEIRSALQSLGYDAR